MMPVRKGVSQNGEWMALPIVFEYFENEEQRSSDIVVLDVRDKGVIKELAKFVETGKDGKAVEENGFLKLKSEILAKCDFYHRAKEYQGRIFNNLYIHRIEILNDVREQKPEPVQPTPLPTAATTSQPAQPAEDADELPF